MKISASASQVTPLAELIEMVQYSAHPPASLLTRWYSQSFLSLLAPPCRPTNKLEPIDGPSTMKTQAQSSTNSLLRVPFMGFVLIWRSRCKFRRTRCNASVSRYSIAGFPQSHLCRCGMLKRLFVRLLQHNSRFWISHGHLALGSGFCNTSLSGYLSASGHDVTVLVADCLCNEKCVLQLCLFFLLLYFIASLFFSLYPFLEALNFASSSLR